MWCDAHVRLIYRDPHLVPMSDSWKIEHAKNKHVFRLLCRFSLTLQLSLPEYLNTQ